MSTVRETLGLIGHTTDCAGMHPRLQANWEEAVSVLGDLGGMSLSAIGAQSFRRDLFGIYLAAKNPASDWSKEYAARTGVTPEFRQLGAWGRRWEEVDGPCAFTVPSTTSAAAAVVIVTWHTMDDATGYPDADTATVEVDGIFDDHDAAVARLKALHKAIRTLAEVARHMDAQRAENRHVGGGDGPAF